MSVAQRHRIRRLTVDDLEAVEPIERTAFDENWPATAFANELQRNGMARYLLMERTAEDDWQAVGFAGLWLIVDEAHVVTLAVDPAERGRGYGRALVHSLVNLAADCGMRSATLECRASNAAARGLYGLYGFWEVGERKAYYPNGEDAVIMTTEDFASEPQMRRMERLAGMLEARFPGELPRLVDAEAFGFGK